MESKEPETETRVIIELPTDLRYAPRNRDVKWRLSWLAQWASVGIAIGREVLKAKGRNIALLVRSGGDFRRLKNFEEIRSLYSGEDKPEDG